MPKTQAGWDALLSYAGEDRETVARPLVAELRRRGVSVWFDESAVSVGDNLRRVIDGGVGASRFGIVILSSAYLRKEWTLRELDGLLAKEDRGDKVILPVWHGVGQDEVTQAVPILAHRAATTTEKGITTVADELTRAIAAERAPGPRRVFIMHVGRRGSVDLDDTVNRKQRIGDVVKALPRDAPERIYFEDDLALDRAFPSRWFNCWGVPTDAEPSFRQTEVGDLVLFAPTVGARGGITAIGVVKAICPIRAERASRVLWPRTPDDRLFPLIFFFDSEVGYRHWHDFADDAPCKPNWNPHGWYRPIADGKFARFGGPKGYLRFLRDDCGFKPLPAP